MIRYASDPIADNIWRHWWAGHLRAVGGQTRLPLLPIEEGFVGNPSSKPGRASLDVASATAAGVAVASERTEAEKVERVSVRSLRRRIASATNQFLDWIGPERVDLDNFRKTFIAGHSDFRNVDFHFIDSLSEEMEGGSRYYLLGEDASDDVGLEWPIDIALMNFVSAQEEIADERWRWVPGDGFQVSRFSTVYPADIRGKVNIVPQQCGILSNGWASETKFLAERNIVGCVNKKWVNIENKHIRSRVGGIGNDSVIMVRHIDKYDADDIQRVISLHFSVSLTERYSWHVAFGYNRGPRLVLPTNPRGCLALFRDRERVGERRAALRHWVDEHYRAKPGGADDVAYVCSHLRGGTRFVWRGLECELMVSAFDLEKNEFFRNQAAEWRARRGHNRIRIKAARR